MSILVTSNSLNESILNESNLPAVVSRELSLIPRTLVRKTSNSVLYALNVSSSKAFEICSRIAKSYVNASFKIKDKTHFELEIKLLAKMKGTAVFIRIYNQGLGVFLELAITQKVLGL